MTRLEDLRELLQGTGLYVDTYSPGDGVTRYRFGDREDYFAMRARFTALGFKEAAAYAQGYADGYFAGYDGRGEVEKELGE